jgi:hypothetical protein
MEKSLLEPSLKKKKITYNVCYDFGSMLAYSAVFSHIATLYLFYRNCVYLRVDSTKKRLIAIVGILLIILEYGFVIFTFKLGWFYFFRCINALYFYFCYRLIVKRYKRYRKFYLLFTNVSLLTLAILIILVILSVILVFIGGVILGVPLPDALQ